MYPQKTYRGRVYEERPFDELAEVQRVMGQWKYLFKITLDGKIYYTHQGHCVGKLKEICRLSGRKIEVERTETREPHKFVPIPKGYVPMSMGECLFYVKQEIPFSASKLKWKFTETKIDGYVMLEGGKLVEATHTNIAKKRILRDARGGAVIFDKKGKVIGHVEVEYDHETDIPIATYWKGKLYSYR